MTTLMELVTAVRRKTELWKAGADFVGRCPFPGHQDDTASFHIFRGNDGKARFYCFGCQEKGDIGDWMTLMEGKRVRVRIDPAVAQARQEEKHRETRWQRFLDRNPDTAMPQWFVKFNVTD